MPFARIRGPGHPDVVCDVIATMIVEEYLRRDPEARVRIQVSGGGESLFINGDVCSQADFDIHPLVARVLAGIGVTAEIEPFVQFTTVAPGLFPLHGTREPIPVCGYAAKETESRDPAAYMYARLLACRLEGERTRNADWFWLGPDFEVCVDDREKRAWIQAEHVSSEPVERVRERITQLLSPSLPQGWRCEINTAGAFNSGGIAHRSGASGSGEGALRSSHLPAQRSGVGYAIRHPLNLGAWLLRKCARGLVQEEKGRAIMIHAAWLPLETRPTVLIARNERGEEVSAGLSIESFDLAAAQEAFTAPGWLLAALRSPFVEGGRLPWEE